MSKFFRFLILASIGLVLGLVLPLNAGDTHDFFKNFEMIVLNLATMIVLPLIFFQVMVNTYEIRVNSEANFTRRSLLMILAVSIFFAFLGILVVTFMNPERLLPINNGVQEQGKFTFQGLVESLFPGSFLGIFSGRINLAPGLVIGALLSGWALYDLRGSIKSILDVSTNAYKLFMKMNSYVVGFIVFLFSIPIINRILAIREIRDIETFLNLSITVFFPVILLTFGIYPAILYFRRKMPVIEYIRLIGQSFFFGLASANHFASYSLFANSVQNRRMNKPGQQWYMAILGVFSRPGTAMVSTIAFLLVLKSYSSLEIAFFDLALIVITIGLVSTVSSAFTGLGIMVVLSLMAGLYGRGMGDSYYILQSILPILVSAAVGLDISTNAFILSMTRFDHGANGSGENDQRSHLLDDFQM